MPVFDSIPDVGKYYNFTGTFNMLTWAQTKNFAQDYALTEYFFESTTQGVGSSHWNTMVALKRIIQKCDAMQAQIDAMGGGVTMDAMLNAMLSATFAELTKFVGLTEAYNVAVWNAPFNADFYAALARGFAKWPEP